jgi:hypothetical protein
MSTALLQLSPMDAPHIAVLKHSFVVGVARGHALGLIRFGHRLALLTEGGEIFMPMEESFFADRFAMFRDRFGTSWMLLKERVVVGRT